jgi:D-alanyl-D-alanine carboxypeptidase
MIRLFAAFGVALSLCTVVQAKPVRAPAELSGAVASVIDRRVEAIRAKTKTPSLSLAIVQDGRIVYAKAYGVARQDGRPLPATPATRYAVGSVSKQFTAAAVLMLAEDGKLSLDDPVGKYVTGLTDGDRITVRQLLNMTAGYQDYWPQDYVPPEMTRPMAPSAILQRWAAKPLDYPTGSAWQYSNTSYVAAGQIAERASGQSLWAALQSRIFRPLGMNVANVDAAALSSPDARGYTRFALGPVRPAVKEGPGWLYAMGWLGMTPSDLGRWDISLMNRSLMSAKSYDAMESDTVLTGGGAAGYGLGLFVSTDHGRRMLQHDGEVSGFLAENRIYPNDRVAIAVLGNADFGSAPQAAAGAVADILFGRAGGEITESLAMFNDLRAGRIDRSKLTANANAYFSPQAVADFASSLGPLGPPASFVRTSSRLRGGMTSEVYSVGYRDGTRLRVVKRALPDGKVEQFMVSEVD